MVYLTKSLILLPPVPDTQDSAPEHLKTCWELGDHFKGTPYFLISYKIWEFLYFVNFFLSTDLYNKHNFSKHHQVCVVLQASDACLQKALFFTGYELSDSIFDY